MFKHEDNKVNKISFISESRVNHGNRNSKLVDMVPVFEWYFYPEFANKTTMKTISIENIKFKQFNEV
jgi:hypothetical protein